MTSSFVIETTTSSSGVSEVPWKEQSMSEPLAGSLGGPAETLAAIAAVRDRIPGATDAQLLAALARLRELRAELENWEPELIDAARTAGVSWAQLAPAVGVASRQAAERRYLRLRSSGTKESTAEGRVRAVRERRAGERAVAGWAREHASQLRQLAGQVSAAAGLSRTGQQHADRVHDALGTDNPADLLEPLHNAGPHLGENNADLTRRITDLAAQTDRARADARAKRGG
jgi:hypothetical protein